MNSVPSVMARAIAEKSHNVISIQKYDQMSEKQSDK